MNTYEAFKKAFCVKLNSGGLRAEHAESTLRKHTVAIWGADAVNGNRSRQTGQPSDDEDEIRGFLEDDEPSSDEGVSKPVSSHSAPRLSSCSTPSVPISQTVRATSAPRVLQREHTVSDLHRADIVHPIISLGTDLRRDEREGSVGLMPAMNELRVSSPPPLSAPSPPLPPTMTPLDAPHALPVGEDMPEQPQLPAAQRTKSTAKPKPVLKPRGKGSKDAAAVEIGVAMGRTTRSRTKQ